MAAYNRTFDLTLNDIELIESALLQRKTTLSLARVARLNSADEDPEDAETLAEIETELVDMHELLGRLHNQKRFFRPRNVGAGPYVSG